MIYSRRPFQSPKTKHLWTFVHMSHILHPYLAADQRKNVPASTHMGNSSELTNRSHPLFSLTCYQPLLIAWINILFVVRAAQARGLDYFFVVCIGKTILFLHSCEIRRTIFSSQLLSLVWKDNFRVVDWRVEPFDTRPRPQGSFLVDCWSKLVWYLQRLAFYHNIVVFNLHPPILTAHPSIDKLYL